MEGHVWFRRGSASLLPRPRRAEKPHTRHTDLCALITLRAAHHSRRHSKRPVDIAHDVRVAQLIYTGKVEWPALPHHWVCVCEEVLPYLTLFLRSTPT